MNIFDQVMSDGAPTQSDTIFDRVMGSAAIVPPTTPVTQPYGAYNPRLEVFSRGVNTGTDLGTSVGTPVSLPPGSWDVEEAYGGARNGYPGDSENRGYGNSVVVKNTKTGEKLRFSHLSQVGVQPGQLMTGGRIGATGATGNVTGPHLDLEYTNPQGQLGDVLQSPYQRYLPAMGGRSQ